MATTSMRRVDVQMTGAPGAPFYSRFFFEGVGPTPQQAADRTAAFWFAIRSVIGTGLTINVLPTVYDVDPVTGQITAANTVTAPSAVAGSASDEKLPFANQGLVVWRTGTYRNGREVRGHTFIPQMTQAANSSGSADPAYRATIQAAAETLRSGDVCVYSPTARQWYSCDAVNVSTKIAVLRSRRD